MAKKPTQKETIPRSSSRGLDAHNEFIDKRLDEALDAADRTELESQAMEAAKTQVLELLDGSFHSAWIRYQKCIAEYVKDNPGDDKIKVVFPIGIKVCLAPNGGEHAVGSALEFSKGKYKASSKLAICSMQTDMFDPPEGVE